MIVWLSGTLIKSVVSNVLSIPWISSVCEVFCFTVMYEYRRPPSLHVVGVERADREVVGDRGRILLP
jgi:hypothetical protein